MTALELIQLRSRRLQQLGYVLIDQASREAYVIDPPAVFELPAGIKIKAVINTHLHSDHTRGNRHFKAPIWLHTTENRLFLKIHNLLHDGFVPGPRLDFRLTDGQQLDLGDSSITVLHTPGHSPGSLCLYWPGNLISGDTLFAVGWGATHFPGGSHRAMRASLKKLAALPPDTIVWPGHAYGGCSSSDLAAALINYGL